MARLKKFDGIFKGVSEIIEIDFLFLENICMIHRIKNDVELYPLKNIVSKL